jgi:hypothetical protein
VSSVDETYNRGRADRFRAAPARRMGNRRDE